MNLVPLNTISLKSLSPEEAAAIEAGKGIKIKDYGVDDLYNRIFNVLDYAIEIRKERLDKWTQDDKGRFVADFLDSLTKLFSGFTYEEVLEAVKAWAVGQIYQEGVHISVHTFCRAIWEWRDVVKREAIAKKNKEEDMLERVKSEQDKKDWEQIFLNDIRTEWSEYKKTRNLDPAKEYYHGAMYKHLESVIKDERSIYKLADWKKSQIYQQAKEEIDARIKIDSIRAQLNSMCGSVKGTTFFLADNSERRKKLTDELIRWQRLFPHAGSKDKHDMEIVIETRVIQRAKKLALKFVFDHLIQTKQELEL